MILIFLTLASSILPNQENNQFANILSTPGILPKEIRNKLNNFISKFTIKLVPKKYSNLIINTKSSSNIRPNYRNKDSHLQLSKLDPNRGDTDFVFYSTILILSLAIVFLLFVLVKQMSNRDNKNCPKNDTKN